MPFPALLPGRKFPPLSALVLMEDVLFCSTLPETQN